jgi:hypothetical protein
VKLSVVIPNRNDSVFLSVTIRSCLEELKSIDDDGEIVIVDNSDQDVWKVLSTINESPFNLGYVESGKVKLVRQPYPGLYAARQHAIEAAEGEYVYNTDSHMIVGYNSFKALVDFMDSADATVGMGFAPIGWLGQHELYARHDLRTDQGTVFGNWGRRYDIPTKICWNFGSSITRRKWFLETHGGYGFYAKKRVSWGGGEMYSAIKSWLLGFENWAVPCSPQYHIGPFSSSVERLGYHYRLYGSSGETKIGIGVLAAFYALAGEDGIIEARKAQKGMSQYNIDVERDWPTARALAHDDWLWLKERQKMTLSEFVSNEPWMNGWNKDRWESWKPYEKIPKNLDLSKLPVLPM